MTVYALLYDLVVYPLDGCCSGLPGEFLLGPTYGGEGCLMWTCVGRRFSGVQS